MSLSSLIVERSIATMRQVEEALARQVIYGGDLATNLLEVCLADEGALTQAVADTMGLAPAAPGPLPEAPLGTRALVPADLAVERAIVPIALQDDRLVLAVAEPVPRELEDHIAFALGMAVEQRVALVMRVRHAIAQAYGVPLERRMQRLVARLAGTPSKVGSTPPPLTVAPRVPEPPRPPSSPPHPSLFDAESLANDAGGAPSQTASDAPTLTGPRPSMSDLFTPHPPAPDRPRDSTDAAHRADTAPAPVQPPPSVRTPVVPAVVPPIAIPGAAPSAPSLIAAAVVLPGVNASPSRPPSPAPIGSAAADHALEREAALLKFNVPLAARGGRRRRGPITWEAARKDAEEATDRDALLDLFFDFARQFFDYAALFLVHGDIAEGRDAFGIGAPRERVLGIGVPLDLPSMMSRARDSRMAIIAPAPPDGLDAVLLADLERTENAETAVVPLVVRTRAVAILLADCDDAGVDPIGVEQVTAFAGVVGKAFERIIVRRKLDGGPASEQVARAPSRAPQLPVSPARPRPALRRPARAVARAAPLPPPSTPSLTGLRAATDVTATTPPPAANIAVLRPIAARPLPREEPDSPPPTQAAGVSDDGIDVSMGDTDFPEIEVATVDNDTREALALFEELGWDWLDDEPSPAPISAIAVPPHRPPSARAHADGELPSVIVDVEQELAAIVERIIAGDADDQAEGELLRQGGRAMRVIMRRFPGPVTVDRARTTTMTTPPRPSDCGPLLRLVARERRVALPFVLERLADPDVETRGWATYLLAELPYVESIPHLIPRLRDTDPGIRASAGRALAAIGRISHAPVRAAILALARGTDPRDRAAAMHAMADMRDPMLVPDLVRALADGDEEVVSSAHDALVQVTRQDFGTDARPWLRWWEQHGAAHRVEWLIDALTHDVSEVRRCAGEELRSLSKETYGYSPDLPARERERAQQRYRDWWLTEGRARLRES